MHAFFHTRPAQRPSIWRKSAPAALRLMQLTVDTAALTTLRQTVMQVCGDALRFMRIEACEHGARMKVWLCVTETLVQHIMETVMRRLPAAEFGRCTVLLAHAASRESV